MIKAGWKRSQEILRKNFKLQDTSLQVMSKWNNLFAMQTIEKSRVLMLEILLFAPHVRLFKAFEPTDYKFAEHML